MFWQKVSFARHSRRLARISLRMKTTALRSALNVAKDFVYDNRKSVFSFFGVFFVAIVAGIFITVNSAGGEFEQIARGDMEFGAVKVFFTASFAVFAGYAFILVAAAGRNLAVVAALPFLVLGYVTGKYSCLLVAAYGATGLTNLLLVYLPFFLLTFVCAAVAGARAVAAKGCDRMKCTALTLLKIFAANVAFAFLFFLIVGSVTKVVIIVF